jgi:hypothetical protein
MKNVLIILGMHRSGTSLISAWLSKCNLNLGDRLGGPDDIGNKLGHYEDLDFLDLHQEILEQNNILKRGLVPPFEFELNEHDYKKLQENLRSKSALYDEWGWKEPRTCLFLRYYSELLPEAKYLISYRDYQFVVESLMRRDINRMLRNYKKLSYHNQIKQADHFEEEMNKVISLKDTYLSTWIIYNQKILDLISSIDNEHYLLTKHSDLNKDDTLVFKCLRLWGFNLSYYPFNSIFDTELINEELPDIVFDKQLESEAIAISEKINEIYHSLHER